MTHNDPNIIIFDVFGREHSSTGDAKCVNICFNDIGW